MPTRHLTLLCALFQGALAFSFIAPTWRPHQHAVSRLPLTMAADTDEATSAHVEEQLESMPEPETALETQQRQVIKILVDRLRLEEAAAFEFKYGKDGGSGEARFMELVQATGSGKGNNLQSLDLQKQKKVLEDEIAEWNKRMIWAQTTVEARDALMERVEAAKEETEAAEATVEPLRVECRKLEKEEKKLRGEKTRLDAAKMQCERSLVTLPAELAKLREALPALESQLKEMTSAVEPLESESEALNEKREALEKDLVIAEASLDTTRRALEEVRQRVEEITKQTIETEEAIATGKAEVVDYTDREAKAIANVQPLLDTLAEVEAEREATIIAYQKAQGRNTTLDEELAESARALKSSREKYEGLREVLKATRVKMVNTRNERNRVAQEDDSTRKELEENEAITKALEEEIDNLRLEAPALFIKRDASRVALEEALDAVERFESGPMGNVLGESDGNDEDKEALGQAVDNRVTRSVKQLEMTSMEVEGRMKVLESFSVSVREAMDAAAGRRAEAQRTLEALADEQKQATAEMAATLNAALSAMEGMQGEWDAAVGANAAELRELKKQATVVRDKQGATVEQLKTSQEQLVEQTKALSTLAEERTNLAEEEEKLRRRFAQLRQRRQAKLQGPSSGPIGDIANLAPDLENLAETAETAKKAAASAAEAALKFGGGALGGLFGGGKDEEDKK